MSFRKKVRKFRTKSGKTFPISSDRITSSDDGQTDEQLLVNNPDGPDEDHEFIEDAEFTDLNELQEEISRRTGLIP